MRDRPGKGLSSRRLARAVVSIVAVAASAVLALAAAVSPARAAITCGDVITESIKLTADLSCPDSDALHVGADGITIDLGGHTIAGGSQAAGFSGVVVDGHGDVKIKNGSIEGFFLGVRLSNASGSTVSGIVTRGDGTGVSVGGGGVILTKSTFVGDGYAIFVEGDKNTVTKNVVSAAAEAGITVTGDDNVVSKDTVSTSHDGIAATGFGNRITKNLVAGNRVYGIMLSVGGTADGNTVIGNQSDGIHAGNTPASTITKNKVSANLGNGIYVSADSGGSLISGNTATGNFENGIDAESTGAGTRIGKNVVAFNQRTGILAQPGVTDLGGNKARGNGDPEGCSPGVIACASGSGSP